MREEDTVVVAEEDEDEVAADAVELLTLGKIHGSSSKIFGAIISAIQTSILERNELKSIHWSAGAISGATMLNLSLLTSDMWAVLIRMFAYKDKVDWMYYVAFAAVAVGLVVYSWLQYTWIAIVA